MLTFLLLCLFNIFFKFYLFKVFKQKSISKKSKTFGGSGVVWFYLEHIRTVYNNKNKIRILNSNAITGPKKLITKFKYRKFISRVINLYKYYWLKINIVQFLELSTFIIFLCFFSIIIYKLYSFNIKTIKKIYYCNFYKLLKIVFCHIKSNLIKFWKLRFNDKIFFGFLFYTYYYGLFKTYIGLDTFVIFKLLFNILFIFIYIFFIVFILYIFYLQMITYLPKRIATLFQLIYVKSIFYVALFCIAFLLVVVNFGSQILVVKNTFKENIFKLLIFYIYMLKIKCQQ